MNFADIEASDAAGDSYFVVGGRAYFESRIYSTNDFTQSFTTKGFYDKLDYNEPVAVNNKHKIIVWTFSTLAVVVAIVGAILLWYYCCRDPLTVAEKERRDRLKKQ